MNNYAKFVNGMVELYSAPIDPETGARVPKSPEELKADGWKVLLEDRSGRPEPGKTPRTVYFEEGDYIIAKTTWEARSR